MGGYNKHRLPGTLAEILNNLSLKLHCNAKPKYEPEPKPRKNARLACKAAPFGPSSKPVQQKRGREKRGTRKIPVGGRPERQWNKIMGYNQWLFAPKNGM